MGTINYLWHSSPVFLVSRVVMMAVWLYVIIRLPEYNSHRGRYTVPLALTAGVWVAVMGLGLLANASLISIHPSTLDTLLTVSSIMLAGIAMHIINHQIEEQPRFIMVTDENLNIRYVNYYPPGWTREEVMGMNLHQHVDPEYHPALDQAAQQAYQTGEDVYFEARSTATYKGMTWYKVFICYVDIDGGAFVYVAQPVEDLG